MRTLEQGAVRASSALFACLVNPSECSSLGEGAGTPPLRSLPGVPLFPGSQLFSPPCLLRALCTHLLMAPAAHLGPRDMAAVTCSSGSGRPEGGFPGLTPSHPKQGSYCLLDECERMKE